MKGFVVNKLSRPKSGEILLTHDIGIAQFKRLAKKGIRCSKDGDPEEAIAVYEAIGRPELQNDKFACVTVHISTTFQARSTTAAYGRGSGITLIIDFESVSDRLLIFNGDVGRLGKALKSGEIDQAFLRSLVPSGGLEEVEAELAKLVENNHRLCQIIPRLQGNSFEARIFGGILPRNVSQICMATRPISEEAKEACELIWKLKQYPNDGAGQSSGSA